MKLISFAIPSYNSEGYLAHAVDSILPGGEEVEILIINDGSTDGTAAIADEYARKYPGIVRAIHKPNGGHGSGVNRGLQEAAGLYYKVVDSDDWVDEQALKILLDTLREQVAAGTAADLYFTNFIYDHVLDGTQFIRDWKKQFPVNQPFGWEHIGTFRGSQVLLMHSLLYRTQALRESGTVLPEHTFYVDNVFAYQPLPYMQKLYYLDIDLYHYYIGREDQSVNIRNFLRRYQQQIRVMECMLEAYSYEQLQALPDGLRRYMLHCLSAVMINTIMFCCCGEEEQERRAAYQALWQKLKSRDEAMYRQLHDRSMPAGVVWMPWAMRRRAMLAGYRLLCKFVKLG